MKSGISTDVLLFAIDCSDKGHITDILTASYTSIGGLVSFFNDSINARTMKKSIPPCPEPEA